MFVPVLSKKSSFDAAVAGRRSLIVAAVLGLLGALLVVPIGEAKAATATFGYTGSVATWTVPAGVHVVNVQVAGANGRGSHSLNSEITTNGGRGAILNYESVPVTEARPAPSAWGKVAPTTTRGWRQSPVAVGLLTYLDCSFLGLTVVAGGGGGASINLVNNVGGDGGLLDPGGNGQTTGSGAGGGGGSNVAPGTGGAWVEPQVLEGSSGGATTGGKGGTASFATPITVGIGGRCEPKRLHRWERRRYHGHLRISRWWRWGRCPGWGRWRRFGRRHCRVRRRRREFKHMDSD